MRATSSSVNKDPRRTELFPNATCSPAGALLKDSSKPNLNKKAYSSAAAQGTWNQPIQTTQPHRGCEWHLCQSCFQSPSSEIICHIAMVRWYKYRSDTGGQDGGCRGQRGGIYLTLTRCSPNVLVMQHVIQRAKGPSESRERIPHPGCTSRSTTTASLSSKSHQLQTTSSVYLD